MPRVPQEDDASPKYNGRIDLMSSTFQVPQYNRTNEDTRKNTPYIKEAVRGQLDTNALSSLYFSESNINALQHGIRFLVWKKTCGKYTISNQSEDELRIVMRSIYLQHSKNLPFGIVEQVKELNGLVLDYCVPKVIEELHMYSAYKRDISTLPIPLDRGVNESIKGKKVLEMNRF
jgi:hypothetical protein